MRFCRENFGSCENEFASVLWGGFLSGFHAIYCWMAVVNGISRDFMILKYCLFISISCLDSWGSPDGLTNRFFLCYPTNRFSHYHCFCLTLFGRGGRYEKVAFGGYHQCRGPGRTQVEDSESDADGSHVGGFYRKDQKGLRSGASAAGGGRAPVWSSLNQGGGNRSDSEVTVHRGSQLQCW